LSTVQIALARSRINDLRARIADISETLSESLGAAQTRDDAAHARLQRSIRALQAVSAELKAVCDEQLNDMTNALISKGV
jgi:hypothetical protein